MPRCFEWSGLSQGRKLLEVAHFDFIAGGHVSSEKRHASTLVMLPKAAAPKKEVPANGMRGLLGRILERTDSRPSVWPSRV